MRLNGTFKSILMLGVATGVAACSNADVASPGSAAPISPIVIVGGGGSTGALPQNNSPSAGCPTGTTLNSNVDLGDGIVRVFCQLSGTVTGTVTLPNIGFPYLLNGTVFVGQDGGATGNLVINSGVTLFGANVGNAPGLDLVVVSRGSDINANGAANAPIVFTSAQDLLNDGLPDGDGGRSEWGGIAINGFAPINDCTANPGATGGTAACTKQGEGGSGLFGGDQPADNSGVMRYVRLQHAGFQFSSTNELNGLALQGVGNGTTLEFIQVHNNGDDGVEFFGGTVNARYLVLTGNDDDAFDWTDGWSGNAQFIIAIQTGTNGDNGIEADNLSSSVNALPRSNPTVSNFTLVSNARTLNSNEGVQIRFGTDGRIVNGIVAGFGEGLEFNTATGAPQPVVNSVAFNGNAALTAPTSGTQNGQAVFAAGTNNRQNATSTLTNGVFPGANETTTPATDPTTLGAFFMPASFAGAFGPADTLASNWTSGWAIGIATPAPACPVGTTQLPDAVPAGRTERLVCRINSPVLGTVTLQRGNLYEIDGLTFVGNDLGATPVVGQPFAQLNIDSGVTLFSSGRANGQDSLTVSRGNRINAIGTPAAPIVMTSREFLFAGVGDSGDWNGLTLNGRAPINDCNANPGATGGTAACSKNGEAGTGQFGGATANDNSGTLNYVRVEFAGFQFSGTNEANSIQLQGVGNGTNIDFVQTLFGADDGIEFFGGTVNVRHAVVVGAEDDAFDWTDGWSGRAQFVIVKQDATFAANENGIEADNLQAASLATPVSNPILSNFTLLGGTNTAASASSSEGIQLRFGTNARILNSIVHNFGVGLLFQPVGGGPTPVVSSTAFTTSNTVLTPDANSNAIFTTGPNNTNNASTLTAAAGTLIGNAVRPAALIIPGANEVTTVTNANGLDPFFTPVTYIGAVQNAGDTWWAGWTRGF